MSTIAARRGHEVVPRSRSNGGLRAHWPPVRHPRFCYTPFGSVRRVAPRDPSQFCFVHAADLHLDTPFHGHRRGGALRRPHAEEASLAAFAAIVELTLERDAAFLVVAGDVYDGAERGLRAQLRFREGLERLSHYGIPSFRPYTATMTPCSRAGPRSAPGPTSSRSSEPKADVATVDRDGVRIATVQGISYATARPRRTSRSASRARPARSRRRVLHCNVTGVASGYANYSACTIEDLQRTNLDYLALGHIHERRVLSPAPGTHQWIVLPRKQSGPEPESERAFPERGRRRPRPRRAVSEVEFVACDRVRFDEIDCDIGASTISGSSRTPSAGLAHKRLADADGRSLYSAPACAVAEPCTGISRARCVDGCSAP